MAFPSAVKIVEVSPRDGLQNEQNILPTATKVDFINQLSETGLQCIEVTSFVSPKWIPQLADHADVYAQIKKSAGISYPVLIPNVKGLQKALDVGVQEIAVFCAASETFSQRNTNCSLEESLHRIEHVIELAIANKIKVRGYISCVTHCPYEGETDPVLVSHLTKKLLDLGCYEISLGDTIGKATPFKIKKLLDKTLASTQASQLAVHFHDTYGQALANIYIALEYGIATIDSSVAGLGGCPYAKGAAGNIATEEVIYMLNEMQIPTQVNLEKLIRVGRYICNHLGIKPQSKVNQAFELS